MKSLLKKEIIEYNTQLIDKFDFGTAFASMNFHTFLGNKTDQIYTLFCL